MDKIKEYFEYYFNIICTVLLISIFVGVIFIVFNDIKKEKCIIKDEKNISKVENIENKLEKNQLSKIKVDIKGAIKKPGVYELEEGTNISELIGIAGGLTKNGSTNNINLSKTLSDQMVIKIFTKNELKTNNIKNVVNECVSETIYINECEKENSSVITTKDDTSIIIKKEDESNNINNNENDGNKKISINKASKEELMTLSKIGEAKAIAIIEYREKNGLFKNIEEIKNVSGIGDALYEGIKDKIEI